jgi:hypothetical protein
VVLVSTILLLVCLRGMVFDWFSKGSAVLEDSDMVFRDVVVDEARVRELLGVRVEEALEEK